jgi:Domain of unknown function (DUF3850)
VSDPRPLHPTHDLKCWPTYFEAIRNGRKTYEIRLNDRNYKVGDTLWLREWNPERHYTGRSLEREVLSVTPLADHPGLEGSQIVNGFVVMSLGRPNGGI